MSSMMIRSSIFGEALLDALPVKRWECSDTVGTVEGSRGKPRLLKGKGLGRTLGVLSGVARGATWLLQLPSGARGQELRFGQANLLDRV